MRTFNIACFDDISEYTVFNATDSTKSVSMTTEDADFGKSETYNIFETNFLKHLDNINSKSALEKDTGILPPGFLGCTKNYVVFERPPEYKNIFLIPNVVQEIRDDSEQYVYRLPIPWTLYIVQMTSFKDHETGELNYYPSNVRMHFMRTNLRDLDQEVYLPPLPNFYANANLCRPMFSSMDDIERYPKDISGVIQSAYDWIWNCGTNMDLTEAPAQMYLQFSNEQASQTAFKSRYSKIPTTISKESYYINFSLLNAFLECWQEIELSEICDLLWPTSAKGMNFYHRHSELLQERIRDYLDDIGEEPEYEYHYNEEQDEYYRCEYEDCECSRITNSVNMSHFLEWAGVSSYTKVTYVESFKNFITLNNPEPTFHTPLSSQVAFRNSISAILLGS